MVHGSKKPGFLLMALGVAAFLVGLINLLVASYHIHFDHGFSAAGSTSSSNTATTDSEEPHQNQPRPPLDSLVQGWNMTGDVSWLLDFAIVGFPKCGTSSLMIHLKNHSQIDIFTDERCDLAYNKQVLLSKDLYNQLSPTKYRGLKCPMDVESTPLSLPNYHKYFPQTKFLVGIRHPVLWFESFYNFRVHNGFSMPPATQLVGRCRKNMKNVCTFRGNFHLFLANLGKTQVLANADELKLFAPTAQRSIKPLNDTLVNRQVFLYEVTQLSDSNPAHAEKFLSDLQQFLGLSKPFNNPMVWFRPGVAHASKQEVDRAMSRKINICEEEYNEIRHLLMEQSINASSWISDYFLKIPSVTVSSSDHFVNEILGHWKRDPCLERSVSV